MIGSHSAKCFLISFTHFRANVYPNVNHPLVNHCQLLSQIRLYTFVAFFNICSQSFISQARG